MPNFLKRFRSELPWKLSAVVFILSLAATLLTSVINFNIIYWPLLPIPILVSLIGAFLISIILKPLDQLAVSPQIQPTPKLSADTHRLEIIVSSLLDGIIVLNKQKGVVLANKVAEKLTGYIASQMVGHSLDTLIILQDKEGNRITSEQLCPATSIPTSQLYSSKDPLTLIGNNRSTTHVRLNCSAINSPEEDLGYIISLEDASSEKQLEAIQLDFVSMASHELRTPLTSIRGYMSVFINENKDKLTKEQTEQLQRIQVSSDQLAAIIDNLLSVSKVERGAFALTAQKTDWNQLLTKVVEDNKLQASSKNISLNLESAEELPQISIDPVRITEVLNNLIGNAINYTKEGGRIDVSSKVDSGELITSVKDTGAGIPSEAIPHLFTKFFRVQGALDSSSNSKGTGLGLYISKSIIDLHKGRIWVESEVGKGSTFSFALPLSWHLPNYQPE